MNANRLINMVLRLVMRKGMAHLSKGRRGSNPKMTSETAKQARQAARQATRLTRRM